MDVGQKQIPTQATMAQLLYGDMRRLLAAMIFADCSAYGVLPSASPVALGFQKGSCPAILFALNVLGQLAPNRLGSWDIETLFPNAGKCKP